MCSAHCVYKRTGSRQLRHPTARAILLAKTALNNQLTIYECFILFSLSLRPFSTCVHLCVSVLAYPLHKFTANEIMKRWKRNKQQQQRRRRRRQHEIRERCNTHKVLQKRVSSPYFPFDSNQIKLIKSLIKVNAHWSLTHYFFLARSLAVANATGVGVRRLFFCFRFIFTKTQKLPEPSNHPKQAQTKSLTEIIIIINGIIINDDSRFVLCSLPASKLLSMIAIFELWPLLLLLLLSSSIWPTPNSTEIEKAFRSRERIDNLLHSHWLIITSAITLMIATALSMNNWTPLRQTKMIQIMRKINTLTMITVDHHL